MFASVETLFWDYSILMEIEAMGVLRAEDDVMFPNKKSKSNKNL